MKEEAVGVHMGIAASKVIIDMPALFLSEKAVFVRGKPEYVSYCYTKICNYKVHHQYFVSTDDHTTI